MDSEIEKLKRQLRADPGNPILQHQIAIAEHRTTTDLGNDVTRALKNAIAWREANEGQRVIAAERVRAALPDGFRFIGIETFKATYTYRFHYYGIAEQPELEDNEDDPADFTIPSELRIAVYHHDSTEITYHLCPGVSDIKNPMLVAATPITRRQWACLGRNIAEVINPNCWPPHIDASHEPIHGRSPEVYTDVLSRNGLVLPTNSEWLRIAWGILHGSSDATGFHWGNTWTDNPMSTHQSAVHVTEHAATLKPVDDARKKEFWNSFGLSDLIGNVQELTSTIIIHKFEHVTYGPYGCDSPVLSRDYQDMATTYSCGGTDGSLGVGIRPVLEISI